MNIEDIIKEENKVYCKPELLEEVHMHYCPGCSHGVIHKLLAEVIAEMGLTEKTVGVSPVGCARIRIQLYRCGLDRGRPRPRARSGHRRIAPLARERGVHIPGRRRHMSAIGTAESIHAANRGENIVMIFVNNAIYGMTGGQMAPTTLIGQKTATTSYGRRVDLNGHPLEITNLMKELDGTCYVTRQSVHTPETSARQKPPSRRLSRTLSPRRNIGC